MVYICENCTQEFNAPPSQKARFCGRACYDTSREGHYICKQCGKAFRDYRSHPKKFCSNSCAGKFMSGENSPHWKGGIVKDSYGYTLVYAPEHPQAHNNKIKEHRLIMEQHLGRYLLPHEIVHHRNHDKADNRIENLIIVTRAEHASLHTKSTGKWASKFSACIKCGTTERKHESKGMCQPCYSADYRQNKKVRI